MSRIGAGLVLGWELGLTASCQTAAFTCETDVACAGLPEGRCEPSGYCSVPDAECGSGRRYAAHSGGLSEQCVEAGETEAGSSSGSAASSGSTLDLDGDGTSGSSSASDPTSGSSDTGVPLGPCAGAVIIDEPFDALPLDPMLWGVYNQPGVAINVLDGELRLEAIAASDAYSGIYTYVDLPQLGVAGVELVAVPPQDAPAEAYLVITDGLTAYGFSSSGGTLYTFFDGADFVDRTMRAYDPAEHRWLRLRFDKEQRVLTWETSLDAIDWKSVDEESQLDNGLALDAAQIDFGAGAWDGPVDADPLAAFGHAFVCEQ